MISKVVLNFSVLVSPPYISHDEQIPTSGIDACGVQAVSQLRILDHVMERIFKDHQSPSHGIVKRPCEVFDVIGGVGSGG
jgi:hypothetical protein